MGQKKIDIKDRERNKYVERERSVNVNVK